MNNIALLALLAVLVLIPFLQGFFSKRGLPRDARAPKLRGAHRAKLDADIAGGFARDPGRASSLSRTEGPSE